MAASSGEKIDVMKFLLERDADMNLMNNVSLKS